MNNVFQVISSLKGIRNARFMTPEVSNAVITYAQNTQIPARLRVAAIQALTANVSQPEVPKKTLDRKILNY